MCTKNQIPFPEILQAGYAYAPITPEQCVALADLIETHDIRQPGAGLRPLIPLLRIIALASLLHDQLLLTPDGVEQFYKEVGRLGLS